MQPFKTKVGKVISLLAYMLKGSDEDGLDIFTQSLHKVDSKRSSKLTSTIDAETFYGISDMRGRLQSLLQEYINKFGTMVPSPKKLWGHAPTKTTELLHLNGCQMATYRSRGPDHRPRPMHEGEGTPNRVYAYYMPRCMRSDPRRIF